MRRYLLMLTAALAGSALLLGACSGGDNEGRMDDLESRLAAVERNVAATGVIAAMNTIQEAGSFHPMDEGINEEGRIEPGYEGTVERVRSAVAGTDWPEALQPEAEALLQALDELLPALQANDVATAGPAATRAHEAAHDLGHVAWSFVAGEETEDGEGGHGS